MSKSSDLKVGDRVRVYGTDRNCEPTSAVGTIVGFAPNGCPYFAEHEVSKKGQCDLTMPHPKQCRRLRVKKRRRLYAAIPDYGVNVVSACFDRDFAVGRFHPGDAIVEFVEVRKGKT
jgi:hypothetical protein